MPALDNITTTVPVGQLQSQDYTGNLMNYGMAGVDPFEFVKMVQTGEVTFDSTNPNQQALLEEYERRAQEANANNPNANLPTAAQAIGGAVVGIAGPMVANTFGQAYANTGSIPSALGTTVKSPFGGGAVSDFKIGDTSEAGSKLLKGTYLKGDNWFRDLNKIDKSTITDRSTLDLIERVQRKATPDGVYRLPNNATTTEITSYNNDVTALKKAGLKTTVPKDIDYTTPWTNKGNIGSSVAVGGTTFVGALIAGAKPKQAAKLAVGTGLGKYLGTAVAQTIFKGSGGFLGGTIGSILGGALGGRVICNELMRQGILDRKHVLLDYRFTRDYLTPTHVRGYHVWAVWMVKQMRKGKFVKFWKHVAGHRANEIAYIYGERDKPDYLGKVYRKILEPICWSVGLLCKKSDWSILYKTKEI